MLHAEHIQLCNQTLITLAGKKCADEYQIWYDLSLQPMKPWTELRLEIDLIKLTQEDATVL